MSTCLVIYVVLFGIGEICIEDLGVESECNIHTASSGCLTSLCENAVLNFSYPVLAIQVNIARCQLLFIATVFNKLKT